MNRIILIGNGFDLAHKMNTSYKHFIDYYWKIQIKEIQKESNNGNFSNEDFEIIGTFRTWDSYEESDFTYPFLKKNLEYNYGSKIIFKNKFLQVITEKTYLKNWVDIENEYYELLIELINHKDRSPYNNIQELNRDFTRIKEELVSYLNKIKSEFKGDKFIERDIGDKIYSTFKLKEFSENVIERIVDLKFQELEREGFDKEFVPTEDKYIADSTQRNVIKEMLLSEDKTQSNDLRPVNILFLNFNYTSTDYIYRDSSKYVNYHSEKHPKIEPEFIHIHGELNKNSDNPIIFGFGDELDNDYKTIEQLNDNAFLENIKSIKYLETDNYKRLLKFLNDDYFQIYIFGHSCGISDRTLLNTLFEHSHCGSVKVFYHKKDGEKDNYSDVIRNISRHFNNKAEMRDKVVNKKYCSPLIG